MEIVNYFPVVRFNIDKSAVAFRSLLAQYLKNALFLKNQLALLIGLDNVVYNPNQFNVIFPLLMKKEHVDFLKDKYTLMPLPQGKVCVTVFANVDIKLITEFINDYKCFYYKDQQPKLLRSKL